MQVFDCEFVRATEVLEIDQEVWIQPQLENTFGSNFKSRMHLRKAGGTTTAVERAEQTATAAKDTAREGNEILVATVANNNNSNPCRATGNSFRGRGLCRRVPGYPIGKANDAEVFNQPHGSTSAAIGEDQAAKAPGLMKAAEQVRNVIRTAFRSCSTICVCMSKSNCWRICRAEKKARPPPRRKHMQ